MRKVWTWLVSNKEIVVRAGELLVAVGIAIRDSLKSDKPTV